MARRFRIWRGEKGWQRRGNWRRHNANPSPLDNSLPLPKGEANQADLAATNHLCRKQGRAIQRRAGDSNPQPLSRHLISSQAAGQFAYPPGRCQFIRGAACSARQTDWCMPVTTDCARRRIDGGRFDEIGRTVSAVRCGVRRRCVLCGLNRSFSATCCTTCR
jgi:hypothetical protein